jgi:ATP-dependent DNA helicase RecQ
MDALLQAHADLAHGADGADKPLHCNRATLARIAADRPTDRAALARVRGMDDARMDRFGAAFLAILDAAR